MGSDKREDIFESNLARMLKAGCQSAGGDFESRMGELVRAEAIKARKRRRVFKHVRRMSAAAAAAALLAAAVLYIRREPPLPAEVAKVTNVYGLVTIENGRPARNVKGTAPLARGQWLTTAWGSRSRIVLADESVFETAVRTRLKLDAGASGALVHLSEGAVNIRAAKQAHGTALTIETPAGRVKVLGTVLDVITGRSGDGTRRTRVSVSSGLEIAGAGGTLELPAGTVGIIDEGRAPVRLSQTPQVNDFLSLAEQTRAIAEKSAAEAVGPMIIEEIAPDGSATVWLMVEIANDTAGPLSHYPLKTTGLQKDVRAYSTGGWPIPTRNLGHTVELDLSSAPLAPGESVEVILCAPRVGGIFARRNGGVLAFAEGPEEGDVIRIVEFRLPRESTLRRISPEPLVEEWAHDRRVVRVAGNVRRPRLFEQE